MVRRTLVALLLVGAIGCNKKVKDDDDYDKDFITNAQEGAAAGVDTDGDKFPDFRDYDSDGDGIPDAIEAGDQDLTTPPIDTDKDGTPDFRDLDSDGDGIPDSCEAGDTDPATAPIDTDGDGIPDYLDLDSDGDGIPDAEEDKNGNCMLDAGESSPTKEDTDGDNVPDLVEKLAGSNPNDVNSTIPATDFYFVLPYQGPGANGNLEFATTLRDADIFFSIDNTGSFDGETANIQATLSSTIIPQIKASITNAAFGVGRFRDFPVDPNGLTSDRPFELLQAITTDEAAVSTAINALPAPVGGLDIPEAGYEALYQWTTGLGLPLLELPAFGGAGFRKDALPIIVHITDSISHVPADYAGFGAMTHGYDDVVKAMNLVGARLVGINSLENSGTMNDPRSQLEDLAVATKATIPTDTNGACPTGIGGAAKPAVMVGGTPRCPVVFDVGTDGAGLGSLIVDAIKQLAALGELDISTRAVGNTQGEKGEQLPAGTTTANFIKAVTPVPPAPTGATINGDVFENVQPGSPVTFKVDAFNDFVVPLPVDQLFTLNLQVLGDGVTVLDTRKVFVIVPKQLDQPIP